MSDHPVDREQEKFFEELDHARALHKVVTELAPRAFGYYSLTIAEKIAWVKQEQTTRTRRQTPSTHPGAKAEKVNRAEIIARDKSTCWLCGKRCKPDEIHLDHVIPLALGGPHTAENLRVACAPCNIRKAAKHPNDLRSIQ